MKQSRQSRRDDSSLIELEDSCEDYGSLLSASFDNFSRDVPEVRELVEQLTVHIKLVQDTMQAVMRYQQKRGNGYDLGLQSQQQYLKKILRDLREKYELKGSPEKTERSQKQTDGNLTLESLERSLERFKSNGSSSNFGRTAQFRTGSQDKFSSSGLGQSQTQRNRAVSPLTLRLLENDNLRHEYNELKENIKKEIRTERFKQDKMYQNRVQNIEKELRNLNSKLSQISHHKLQSHNSFDQSPENPNSTRKFSTPDLQAQDHSKIIRTQNLTIHELQQQVLDLQQSLDQERSQHKQTKLTFKTIANQRRNDLQLRLQRLLKLVEEVQSQDDTQSWVHGIQTGLKSVLHSIGHTQMPLPSHSPSPTPYLSNMLYQKNTEITRYASSASDDLTDTIDGQSVIPSINASPYKLPSTTDIQDLFMHHNQMFIIVLK